MTDDEMRRTTALTPRNYAAVEDFLADYALDAAEAIDDADGVAQALRHAAEEVDYQAREDNIDVSDNDDGREEPARSEPADFGGGESTGVQDL